MKILKRILIGLVILILALILIVRVVLHEGRPTPVEGNADEMAHKMLLAVDKDAWDSLKYVQWTFPRGHSYVWDKPNNNARVSWDNMVVHLDMDAVDGKAFQDGKELVDDQKSKAVQEAWSFWCNDSFWFTAPFKVFDKGTKREVATDSDGKKGLLITYESGGVTPGDQYLWFLDNEGLPTGYKMWVKIIPIGGVYASWVNYTTLAEGSKVAQSHTLSLANMQIEMTDIKSGQSWSELGYSSNPIEL